MFFFRSRSWRFRSRLFRWRLFFGHSCFYFKLSYDGRKQRLFNRRLYRFRFLYFFDFFFRGGDFRNGRNSFRNFRYDNLFALVSRNRCSGYFFFLFDPYSFFTFRLFFFVFDGGCSFFLTLLRNLRNRLRFFCILAVLDILSRFGRFGRTASFRPSLFRLLRFFFFLFFNLDSGEGNCLLI